VRWYATHFPSIRPVPGALSGAELGCWASHLSAWARIRESGEAAGTVLEDDLVLAPGFGARVRELGDDLGDFDLVYLGTSSRNLSRRRVTTIGRHRVHAPVGLVVNTLGVRREFALDRARARAPVPRDHDAHRPLPRRARRGGEAAHRGGATGLRTRGSTDRTRLADPAPYLATGPVTDDRGNAPPLPRQPRERLVLPHLPVAVAPPAGSRAIKG